MLSTSIHSFETAKTTLCDIKLSDDFDTATEQMDGAKVGMCLYRDRINLYYQALHLL